MMQCTQEIAEEHYKDLKEKPFFPALVEYILSGPVVCMVSVICLIGFVTYLPPSFIRKGDRVIYLFFIRDMCIIYENALSEEAFGCLLCRYGKVMVLSSQQGN
jgi:hypothetical protein